MNDNSGKPLVDESSDNNFIKDNNHNKELENLAELSELRSLLLGIEEDRLQRFYEKIDNPQVDAEDISNMLPKAVMLRTMKDEQLGEAMVPTVEQAINSSVQKDINVLSQAIFPIIGPATRKAIATALDEMLQSFNQALDHSVSPQSLKWRIEAKQTGKSFAEVVLLRTLIYRVEQVFLIHKDSGLMLQHVVVEQVASQDPSLISAMLTAIQDFVRDSFNVRKHEGLHSLEFGELTIWIEEGPGAVLASIIRGNAPEELRFLFKNAIETIHLNLGKEIYSFSGDTEVFDPVKPYLQDCLASHYQTPKKEKKYTYAWILLGVLAIALGTWGYFTIRDNNSWNSYIKILEAEPGISVTKAYKKGGKYFIAGIRDPLATEPKQLLKDTNINPENIEYQWKSAFFTEPKIIERRISRILDKPETVKLEIGDNGTTLHAKGSAPQKWILAAREKAKLLSILGIVKYNDKSLKDLDIAQLNLYKRKIESTRILFDAGTTQISQGEAEKRLTLATKIKELVDASEYLKQSIVIEISGHADTTGDETKNFQLSQRRASEVLRYFTSQGINENIFTVEGFGSQNILKPESSQEDKRLNRRVSFKVTINDNVK